MNEWTHPYLTTASIYCIMRYKLRNILFCSEPFSGFSLSLYKMKMLYDNLSLWLLSAHFHRPNSFPFQDLLGVRPSAWSDFFPPELQIHYLTLSHGPPSYKHSVCLPCWNHALWYNYLSPCLQPLYVEPSECSTDICWINQWNHMAFLIKYNVTSYNNVYVNL